MKVTNFLSNDTGLVGAWAKLAQALAFPPPPRGGLANGEPVKATAARPGILERIDRWFWKQEMRDREAYLAGAQDIFELEERIRRLERSTGSRYY